MQTETSLELCFPLTEFVEWLSGERSTVRLGDPSCFRVTTILWHHSTGSPKGTCPITHIVSSRRRSSCTCCCQWTRTGMVLLQATGIAPSFRWISTGGPTIAGSYWCLHTLNVKLLVVNEPFTHLSIVLFSAWKRWGWTGFS